MPNNDAAKSLEQQVAKWDALSAIDKEKAAQNLGFASAEALEPMIRSGGLSDTQKNLLNTVIPGYLDGNAGYDPAISVATDFTGGTNLNQGINQNLINGYTGNILGGSTVGLTSPLAGIQDRATDITNTQGQAGLNELVDAQRTLGDVISTGGMTGDLEQLKSLGMSLVRSGGFTPELMSFLNNSASTIIAQGGITPEMAKVFATAQGIIDAGGEGGALLPTEQIISFARDEATARGQDQFAAAQRSAIQRGMTPGAVTGVGGNFAEFADEIGQGEAKALRDASLGAQEQRLQQYLAALGTQGQVAQGSAQLRAASTGALGSLYSSGAGAAAAGLNAGASMANNAANVASQYFNTATNGMVNIGQIFADREQNAFDNIFGVNNAINQNVGFGSDLARSGINDQMAGVSLLNASQGGANNDILGFLGLQSQGYQNGQNNVLNASNQMINIGGMQMSAAQFYSQLSQMTASQRAQIMSQPGLLAQLAGSFVGGFGSSLGTAATGGLSGALSTFGNPSPAKTTPGYSNDNWF